MTPDDAQGEADDGWCADDMCPNRSVKHGHVDPYAVAFPTPTGTVFGPAATHAPSVEALTAEVERLRDFKLGTEVMRWPEEAHRQHAAASDARAQRDALAARLDRLRAGIEGLHTEGTYYPEHYHCDPDECDRSGEGEPEPVCETCGTAWPCPTRALLAEDEATGRGEGA